MRVVWSFFAAFVLAVAGVALCRKWVVARGWVAKPRKDRWHTVSTALHGGLGFFPAFLAVSLAVYFLHLRERGWSLSLDWGVDAVGLTGTLFLGSALMFLTGLLDDIFHFSPAQKLLGQITAVSGFVFAGGTPPFTGFFLLDVMITYVWFIGIVNAVNLIDNMDGVCSLVVAVAALVLGWIYTQIDIPSAVLGRAWCSALSGAALGFWVFNRPPAKIFMGDSGSLFLGFTLAALSLPSPINGYFGESLRGVPPPSSVFFGFCLSLSVLAVPIMDTALVTVTRLMRGQSPAVGGRDHSSHRLVLAGLSEPQTMWVLGGMGLFCGALAVVMFHLTGTRLILFPLLYTALLLVAVYLGLLKVETGEQRVSYWLKSFIGLLVSRVPALKFCFDIALVALAYYAAYLLRFDFVASDKVTNGVMSSLPLAIVACLSLNVAFGIYGQRWMLISGADLLRHIAAGGAGVFATVTMITLINRFEKGHSRGAMVIFALLYLCGLVGSRLSFRFLNECFAKIKRMQPQAENTPVLVYGAGRMGRLLAAEISHLKKGKNVRVLGFVDDNPELCGQKLVDLPISSPEEWAGSILKEDGLEIWVSSDGIPDQKVIELKHMVGGRADCRRFSVQVESIGEKEEP